MVQQVRDSECLDFVLVRVDGGADALPPAKDQCDIVVCKWLLGDKKERYLFEPEEQQRSDRATYLGNRLAGIPLVHIVRYT